MSRRKRNSRAVLITSRDRALIALHGVASAAQIHARFWPGRQRQTALDRLGQLAKGGYLHAEVFGQGGDAQSIYWVGRKGRSLFGTQERAAFLRGKPARAELAHTLKMIDVLDRLEQRGTILSWQHEHTLKAVAARSGQRLPVADAAVVYARDGIQHRFHIEVDGAYTGKRLYQKIQALGQSGQPILWVVYSEYRLHRLTRLCAPYANLHVAAFDSL